MNGCMAHVKDNPREGVVIGINREQVYGGEHSHYPENMYADIRLDNGNVVKHCAAPRLWYEKDGLFEYQE